MPSVTPEDRIPLLRRRTLTWYRQARRDLPWRHRQDAYAIWVSEIMLQQTRVDVVIPYFERFMGQFPDVRALARAPLAEVLQAWSGLGYYSRARNLHAAAGSVVRDHAARVPSDAEALEALPGIGRYTAGAIRSIAFGAKAPILDGNVARVLARLFAVETEVQAPATQRTLWRWAAAWADAARPGDANQALMELGALVCTRPSPACERCPVESSCAARATGRERALPLPRRRPEPQRVELDALLAHNRGRVLVVRRAKGRLLRDWWELPTARRDGDGEPALFAPQAATRPAFIDAVERRFACTCGAPQRAARVRHGILQHDLHVTAWSGAVSKRHPAARSTAPPQAARHAGTALATIELEELEVRWVTAAECRALPLATLARKVLRAAAGHDARWAAFVPPAR
jgi:A/G-specific adenine glycosylase